MGAGPSSWRRARYASIWSMAGWYFRAARWCRRDPTIPAVSPLRGRLRHARAVCAACGVQSTNPRPLCRKKGPTDAGCPSGLRRDRTRLATVVCRRRAFSRGHHDEFRVSRLKPLGPRQASTTRALQQLTGSIVSKPALLTNELWRKVERIVSPCE